MTAWEVRRAVDADAERIAAITVAGWRHAYRGIVDDDRLAALDPAVFAADRRRLIAAPPPTGVLVAQDDDGPVVGYAVVGASHAPERDGHPTLPTAELAKLYVDPALIGAGAGTALHDAGLAHLAAAGFAHVVLWVYTANTAAVDFYRRRGWHSDGNPWHPPEWAAPATRLARSLP